VARCTCVRTIKVYARKGVISNSHGVRVTPITLISIEANGALSYGLEGGVCGAYLLIIREKKVVTSYVCVVATIKVSCVTEHTTCSVSFIADQVGSAKDGPGGVVRVEACAFTVIASVVRIGDVTDRWDVVVLELTLDMVIRADSTKLRAVGLHAVTSNTAGQNAHIGVLRVGVALDCVFRKLISQRAKSSLELCEETTIRLAVYNFGRNKHFHLALPIGSTIQAGFHHVPALTAASCRWECLGEDTGCNC
jgi:hypothetical protein